MNKYTITLYKYEYSDTAVDKIIPKEVLAKQTRKGYKLKSGKKIILNKINKKYPWISYRATADESDAYMTDLKATEQFKEHLEDLELINLQLQQTLDSAKETRLLFDPEYAVAHKDELPTRALPDWYVDSYKSHLDCSSSVSNNNIHNANDTFEDDSWEEFRQDMQEMARDLRNMRHELKQNKCTVVNNDISMNSHSSNNSYMNINGRKIRLHNGNLYIDNKLYRSGLPVNSNIQVIRNVIFINGEYIYTL